MWKIPNEKKAIYLTFDDGPTPRVTQYVLDQLRKYQAEATFFVLGNQVKKYPEILKNTKMEGHAIGNHTYSHPSGWGTGTRDYLNQVSHCDRILKANKVETKLFRPPYGRVTFNQAAILYKKKEVIMWSMLSGDFDTQVELSNAIKVLMTAKPGDILVFHDSVKAFPQLQVLLPQVLEYYSHQGFEFKKL